VESESDKERVAKLTGTSSAGHRFHGVIAVDRKRNVLKKFTLAEFHEAGHADRTPQGKPTGAHSPIGVAFELATGETGYDRLYPIFFSLGWGGTIEENNRAKMREYLGQGAR
jgi:hypothetical protein